MNIIKFLDSISTQNFSRDEKELFSSRREAFKKMGGVSKKMALAAIPTAIFAAMPRMVKAQSTASVIDVLNYALTLEYLESEYYQMGSDAEIYTDNTSLFDVIRDHEAAHVQFLLETIDALGETPATKPTFDFTANGTFPDPFAAGNYPVFLALSQAFEDTGVRAYKGQATALMAEDDILTAALQIHSVEARHASVVRRLRNSLGLADIKGWITGADPKLGDYNEETQAVYGAGIPAEDFPAEDNVVQGGVNLGDALTDFTTASITESFDEPLDMDTVNAIAGLFIVS